MILTPPAPGNQRGAVWSNLGLSAQYWEIDVDFRVNGPERASGNLVVWLAHDGGHEVGASSVYTVGRFEGLAVLIDQQGGTGGMIRGFLNDGMRDYRHEASVDSLSFGHCLYAYRNRGSPSQLKLRHDEKGFHVEIDGHMCFESPHVEIPPGYHVGVTAASADNPDSAEVFRVVVTSDHEHASDRATLHAHLAGHEEHQEQERLREQQERQAQPPIEGGFYTGRFGQSSKPPSYMGGGKEPVIDDPYDNAIPDTKASSITSSAAQFADLHDRLQSLNHHIGAIFRTVGHFNVISEGRHAELTELVSRTQGECSKLDVHFEAVSQRVANLEKQISLLRSDLSSALKSAEGSIRDHVTYHHEDMKEHVEMMAPPGHGSLILVFIALQLCLIGVYAFYKRRKAAAPKKYL